MENCPSALTAAGKIAKGKLLLFFPLKKGAALWIFFSDIENKVSLRFDAHMV